MSQSLIRIISIIIIFQFSSCATTNVSNFSDTDTKANLLEDEQDIWARANRLEAKIIKDDGVVEDEQLNNYLLDILNNLIDSSNLQTELIDPRVYVINSSNLNAFVLPNGAVYLTTGILTRMESNAQVATLLGHELTHFVNRHSLQQARKAEKSQKINGFLNLLMTAATGTSGGLGNVVEASILGNYSREMESEADLYGLNLMVGAGYNPAVAPDLFTILLERTDGDEGSKFFASHPKLKERLKSYQELIKTTYSDHKGINDSAIHSDRIKGISYSLADFEITKGLYKEARKTLEFATSRYGESSEKTYYEYELSKQDPKSNSDKAALELLLLKSVSTDDAPANAYREAGFLYRSKNDNNNANNMFKIYLLKSPDAVDADIIQSFIQ